MNDQSNDPAPLKHAKGGLRAQMRARRDALEARWRASASAAIVAKLLRLKPWGAARCVLAYSSIGSELQMAPLLATTLAQGKRLLLPRINQTQHCLDLYRVSDMQRDTQAGVWGIREPHASGTQVSAGDVDLVIVPGLAFDPTGNRMGYGGGYYDQLLPRLDSRCWRIALAFDTQVVAEVPHGANDQRVDLIITEAAEYAIRSPSAAASSR
jgi:5-formyltetrahydrofolate cyclo-ligase